jgi:hypothetical protein
MQEWYQLQHNLYKQIQRELKPLVRKKSKSLQNYEKVYVQDLKNFKASSRRHLIQALNSNDLVLINQKTQESWA